MTPSRRRLRTPTRNRELLIEPSFAAIPELLDENRRRLDASAVRIDGHFLRDLRRLARSELYISDPDVPLVVTGHQPELFHPGVWVKNFAAAGLAQRVGGAALNLVVDNDLVKSADIKLPAWETWEPKAVRLQSCPFAATSGDPTWETLTASEADRRPFLETTHHLARNWGYTPLLDAAAEKMVGRTVGEGFVAARRSFEKSWGCDTAEVFVSRLSRTEAFCHFARHLLHDYDRFRTVYNTAVQAYRRRYGLRSRTHPVPDLAADESPFWAVVENRRLKATPRSSPHDLRPRALTLTLFARLCLGDLFLHGIGGGKYDEVTDQIIRDYFGLEPPAFQVLSGTLLLPLPSFPATPDDLMRQSRLVRDLHWNPQRHLPRPSAEHARLRELNPADRGGRRQRYRDLRAIVERLRPNVMDELRLAESRLHEMKAEVAANAILQRRDYSWVLYPEELLRPFLQDVQRRAASD